MIVFDRFIDWVNSLPIRPWVFYILFGIVLVAVQIIFLWLEGSLSATELLPVIIYNGLATSFLLGLIHLLDHQATKAMHGIRSVLDTTDEEFKDYVFKLTNMPVAIPMGVGLFMFLLVMLMEQFMGQPLRYAALEQLPCWLRSPGSNTFSGSSSPPSSEVAVSSGQALPLSPPWTV